MFTKKMVIILYTVFFVGIVLISTVFAFSVSKIDTEITFISEDNGRSISVDDKLSSFLGKNLLFLDTENIKESLISDPYIDCISVEKSYPDTVKVVAKERRETYLINFDDETYIADENGFILRKYDGEKKREHITLVLSGLEVEKPVVGSNIKTDYDDSVKNAFEIAKSVDLTDKIDKMTVKKEFGGNLTAFNVEFLTYTNVTIKITKSDDDGVNKALAAFDAYDFKTTDYEKSFYSIEAIKLDSGAIRVTWTRGGEIIRETQI